MRTTDRPDRCVYKIASAAGQFSFCRGESIVRSILTVTAVVATTCILSACIGENKHQVNASCRLQYSRSDGTISPSEYRKIGMCMEAHGFEIDQELCTDPEPILPDCFKPMTLENKIRAYVE